ncbi:protein windpipe [Diorhabda carinulata]|uniref:protein windpipe n=1 Tax=Diorhabda carinulata TaxID=1163345 RepID=UPI0025A16D91|nr:protein windpipe [Diorhabda carinulata]
MWKEWFLFMSILGYCLGATLEICPEGSSCHNAPEQLRVTSFEFLSKMSQKDFRSIGSLILSNASVNKVDPKLKYLKNLEYLDLSHNSVQVSSIPALNSLKTLILKSNDLKDISVSNLPQNLEHLDLSNNLLSDITRDWRMLKNLKTLDLFKNPIDCDCNNVLNLELLNKSGIIIPRPLTCHSPSKFAGKDVSAVTCSPADIMQYDEPVEGSGDPDIFEDSYTEQSLNVPVVDEEEEEDRNATANTFIDDEEKLIVKTTTIDSLHDTFGEEGSGDEGSGFGIIPESGVLGCIENCSTPKPLDKDSTASPLPGIFDQLKMVIDDINIFKESEPSTSTLMSSTSTITVTTTTTEVPVSPVVVPDEEPTMLKERTSLNENTHESMSTDNQEDANITAAGELERASVTPKNTTAVYAIVGVGLCIAVLFIIAFVKKRKSKRMKNNRRENTTTLLGEEMKPLSKPPLTSVNDKPARNSSNIPEHIPLINGQNGKSRDDTPKLTSFTPLAHPELPDKGDEDEPSYYNGTVREPEQEVDIRSKSPPELQTPQGTRVTIRESEIPESIPRTPLLVHRQKNSDGEIVTTLVS